MSTLASGLLLTDDIERIAKNLYKHFAPNPLSTHKCLNCGHECAHNLTSDYYCDFCLTNRTGNCTEKNRLHYDLLAEIARLSILISQFQSLRRCLTCTYIGEGEKDVPSTLDHVCPKCRTSLIPIPFTQI